MTLIIFAIAITLWGASGVYGYFAKAKEVGFRYRTPEAIAIVFVVFLTTALAVILTPIDTAHNYGRDMGKKAIIKAINK